jgi:2,5-diketo-D-gluconate reductase A
MTIRGPVISLNNGVDLPAVGLGVYRASPEETAGAVIAALQFGYRMTDTAAAYFNEPQVGAAIRDSGVDRAEIFVQTKAWITDYGEREIVAAYERSLGKLGIEAIDLYRLHQPAPAVFDRVVAAWKGLERLLAEGRVRAIGVGNFSADHLDRLTCARRTRGSASSPRPGRRSAASTATRAPTSGRRTTRSAILPSSASRRSTGRPRPR